MRIMPVLISPPLPMTPGHGRGGNTGIVPPWLVGPGADHPVAPTHPVGPDVPRILDGVEMRYGVSSDNGRRQG